MFNAIIDSWYREGYLWVIGSHIFIVFTAYSIFGGFKTCLWVNELLH